MSEPYPNPHTPEERRRLSNLGHWLEGSALGLAGSLALLDAAAPSLKWPGRWWPRAVAAGGGALGAFIVLGSLHHGGPRRYLRYEPQDREHLQMAALIGAGGALESLGRSTALRLAPAAALGAVGQMFLSHEQHGTGEARRESERVHRRLGLTVVAGGLAKAGDALGMPGPWRWLWPSLTLASAGQLLVYREPAGAYE